MAISSDTCSGTPLLAGASCAITVRYTPVTSHETSTYKLEVSSASSITNSTQVVTVSNIIGTSVKAAKLSFADGIAAPTMGPIAVSTSVTTTLLQIQNTGDQTATSFVNALSGTKSSNFSIEGNTCGPTLAGGANCSLQLKFTPGTEMGPFSATLSTTSTQSSVTRSLKAASFGEMRTGALDSGYENDMTYDSTRFYMVSRKLKVGTGQGKFTVLVNVCQKTAHGSLDQTKCVATDLDGVFGLTDSNIAGNLNGSGPRILESGSKLIIAIQNKEPLFSGETLGGTATVITCKKPTLTSSADVNFDKILSCDKTVLDNGTSNGQFPSLALQGNKIALATSGRYNNLLLQVCDIDLTTEPATFANCARRDFVTPEQGWYPSIAFSAAGQLAIATYDQSDPGNLIKGVRISTCTVGASNSLTCASSLIDSSNSLEFGLYPSLAISGSKVYVAHQVGKIALAGVRLTGCNIDPSTGLTNCSSVYVTATATRGAIPRLAVSPSTLWITATRWENTQTAANRIEVYKCSLATAPAGCAASSLYAAQAISKGLGPIYNRSGIIDATKALLIAPYMSGESGFEQSSGFFILGLIPEF